MNSLLSNLGPRYSRRNNTTPIVLGFLLLIIAIAVATYFITRDDDDDDGKDKKDENEGETVPTIGDINIKRTLNPDSSNSSESGTTETYEIGGGKTETYQIEYNTGVDRDTMLSKNVSIDISWTNKFGFDDVYKLDIEHWVSTLADDTDDYIASNPNRKPNDTHTINRYDGGAQSGTEIPANAKFFTDFYNDTADPLSHTFRGDGTYTFVGRNTFRIKAYYRNTSGYLYHGKLANTSTDVVTITSDDLLATTASDWVATTREYNPMQSGFQLGQAIIADQAYYASTQTDTNSDKRYDIHWSMKNNTGLKPFTLVRASDSTNNEFYFKFDDNKYLSYCENQVQSSEFVDIDLCIKDEANRKVISLVESPRDVSNNGHDERHFRLELTKGDLKYYIVIVENKAVIRKLSDIDEEGIFKSIDWYFTLDNRTHHSPGQVVCPRNELGQKQIYICDFGGKCYCKPDTV
tara:strand:- start:770 stop:2158 length:1389 start_codon:yes stop_codon:yes gene_type:complete